MDLNECLAEDSGCSSFKHGGCELDESYKINEVYLNLDDCRVRYQCLAHYTIHFILSFLLLISIFFSIFALLIHNVLTLFQHFKFVISIPKNHFLMMIAKERLDLQNLTLNSVLQVGKKSGSRHDVAETSKSGNIF